MRRVELRRDVDVADYCRELEFKYYDDPEYKFYNVGGSLTLDSKPTEYDWGSDMFCIYWKNQRVGIIVFHINVKCHYVGSVGILLEKEYLNSGLGVLALQEFVKYCFEYKKFHKICFTVMPENKRAFRIYSRAEGYREVGTQKRHVVTPDREFHDVIIGEIINEKLEAEYDMGRV